MSQTSSTAIGVSEPSGNKGKALLQEVWDAFKNHDEWPTVDHIDRMLFRRGILLEEALRELSSDLLDGDGWHLGSDRLRLTFAGAFNCANSAPEIRMYLRLVELATEIECGLHEPFTARVIDAEVLRKLIGRRNLPADSRVAYRAALLAGQEPAFLKPGGIICVVGSKESSHTWSLRFDRSIRAFIGVADAVLPYWTTRQRLVAPTETSRSQEVSPPGQPQPESPPDASFVVTLTVHPEIAAAAADRFANGQHADAVMRAFQAVEHRVQTLVGSAEVGTRLMGAALGSDTPKLVVTRAAGPSLPSEREGLRDLFKGAMAGLRNPRAHGPHYADDPEEAREMLAFASLLMRRLDHAEAELRTQSTQAARTP